MKIVRKKTQKNDNAGVKQQTEKRFSVVIATPYSEKKIEAARKKPANGKRVLIPVRKREVKE